MDIRLRKLTGTGIFEAIGALADLRIRVFAEWPYLYAGDPDYEAEYLREFGAAPGSLLVAACDGERIVGAATASPMQAQAPELRAPFEVRGYDIAHLFYFGESVLLPEFRGQGIGHAFFDAREAQARVCGAQVATFAAVVRTGDHPRKPPGYRPLDGFWTKRGYAPAQGLVAELAWKDHDEPLESPKPMQFWMRDLGGG